MLILQSLADLLDKLLYLLLLPATFYGAGGAFLHARRKGKPFRQTLVEVVGGIITVNMLSPLVQDSTPEKWHYTLFFLVGWGGLELMGRLDEVAVGALERRISKKIGGEE